MDLISLIIGIVALIILHEFGHFLLARLNHIKVEEFGIGFPPRIRTLFRWKETEFTLNWIPLGGFVRPVGENDPDVPGGLASANPRVRLSVMLAGPLMNLLVAGLLYGVAFSQWGTPDVHKIVIVQVAANSPAAQAGLQVNDLLVRLDDVSVDGIESVIRYVSAHKGEEITISYQRDDQIIGTKLVPRINPPKGEGAIGIAMSNPTQPMSVIQAIPLGFSTLFDQIYQMLTLPVRLAQGLVSAGQIRFVGYKGIYDIYQDVRDADIAQPRNNNFGLLAFFGMLSASLGILNLLPFPALDGGRILFAVSEMIFHRRVPAHLENMIHVIGLMLLLLFMVYVNLQDFIHPLELPH